ncbi:MAG: hypothetical protein ACLP1X_19880, partial [Polyangiaceae bacterium]
QGCPGRRGGGCVMRRLRWLRATGFVVLPWAALLLSAGGCTYGTVTDASTGTPPGSAFGATPIPALR